MNELIYIIIASFIISLISFFGIIIFSKRIENFMHYFISFAAAALLSSAFLDLIPESIEIIGNHVSLFILMGILLFFLVERFIHWHHCGKSECHKKPAGTLNLIGDAIHNFIDGIIIAGAFMLNLQTGILTALTVIIHEIPQEFGDFTVLIHSGYNKIEALKLNFYIALFSVLGGVIGYFTFSKIQILIPYITSIAAGGFIYLALSDIVPEIHKHNHHKNIIFIETFIFVITIEFFYILLQLFH